MLFGSANIWLLPNMWSTRDRFTHFSQPPFFPPLNFLLVGAVRTDVFS